MFVHSTNHKGAVAELEIDTAATALDIPVLRPMAEHSRYDLVFEIGERLWRVACKWGSLGAEGSIINVRVGGSRVTPHGYVLSTYREDEIAS